MFEKGSAKKCLPGFEHINRHWDSRQGCYVAKILPGEFYVTRYAEGIATTLGSCISACIWDENNGIGGMNHFMLPLSGAKSNKTTWGVVPGKATRYGNYAMEHLINEIMKNGGERTSLSAKIFGGGNMLRNSNLVGEKNIEFVIKYLKAEKISIVSEDLGDVYSRRIVFYPLTGKVLVKKMDYVASEISARELIYRQEMKRVPVEGDTEFF